MAMGSSDLDDLSADKSRRSGDADVHEWVLLVARQKLKRPYCRFQQFRISSRKSQWKRTPKTPRTPGNAGVSACMPFRATDEWGRTTGVGGGHPLSLGVVTRHGSGGASPYRPGAPPFPAFSSRVPCLVGERFVEPVKREAVSRAIGWPRINFFVSSDDRITSIDFADAAAKVPY